MIFDFNYIHSSRIGISLFIVISLNFIYFYFFKSRLFTTLHSKCAKHPPSNLSFYFYRSTIKWKVKILISLINIFHIFFSLFFLYRFFVRCHDLKDLTSPKRILSYYVCGVYIEKSLSISAKSLNYSYCLCVLNASMYYMCLFELSSHSQYIRINECIQSYWIRFITVCALV